MNDITVDELHTRISNKEHLNILDVREPLEHDMANIGGMLIPLADLPNQLEQLSDLKDQEIIVYCRSGMRSARATEILRQRGINAVSLTGGLLAWHRQIDATMVVA